MVTWWVAAAVCKVAAATMARKAKTAMVARRLSMLEAAVWRRRGMLDGGGGSHFLWKIAAAVAQTAEKAMVARRRGVLEVVA